MPRIENHDPTQSAEMRTQQPVDQAATSMAPVTQDAAVGDDTTAVAIENTEPERQCVCRLRPFLIGSGLCIVGALGIYATTEIFKNPSSRHGNNSEDIPNQPPHGPEPEPVPTSIHVPHHEPASPPLHGPHTQTHSVEVHYR